MTERETQDRLDAAAMLHRAGIAFDTRDVRIAAGIVVEVEAAIADWLDTHLPSIPGRARIVSAVRDGCVRRYHGETP